MNKMQQQVREFHIEMDLWYKDFPWMLDIEAKKRRVALIAEELAELKSALLVNDMIEAVDAVADLLYVVFGIAVELGVDIEPFFDEVHRSNMTKVGGHKREDGKWMKPHTYEPANLRKVWLYSYGKADPDSLRGQE